MTVGTQMQQVIATLQSASATLKGFALETEDQNAKTQFQQIAESLDNNLQTLKDRQAYINEQEPQFKQ
ncbi:DUF1657 domain-containing protein [Alkaliphilus pronyensis]|uniref:DUF1657 domain-containing protein n=1 Tax=Alkaliphilus pronyensis TaxID=1482732 RepID=A0A6I0EY00_9FIRM|nr:DUF1657 domain-containing protein [Alkaliphilus pronyensis]KAB3532779.1 DUF1657 domain-containing protein [Alkaliphilus pronyensis]